MNSLGEGCACADDRKLNHPLNRSPPFPSLLYILSTQKNIYFSTGPQSSPEHHHPCSHQLDQFLLHFHFSPAAKETLGTLHIYWDVLFSGSFNIPVFQRLKKPEPITQTSKGSFHHLCQGIPLMGTAPTFLFCSPLNETPRRVLCYYNDHTPYIEM